MTIRAPETSTAFAQQAPNRSVARLPNRSETAGSARVDIRRTNLFLGMAALLQDRVDKLFPGNARCARAKPSALFQAVAAKALKRARGRARCRSPPGFRPRGRYRSRCRTEAIVLPGSTSSTDSAGRPGVGTARAPCASTERSTPSEISFAITIGRAHALSARSEMPKAICFSTSLKENVMNEELELEIVELGDAKEETKGLPNAPHPEESPQILFRQ